MLTRRRFLTTGAAAAGGAALGGGSLAGAIEQALAAPRRRRATIHEIEHVVVLMQENRSFDHYFGTLRGVRGFGDRHVPRRGGRPAWRQADPDLKDNPQGYVLPFRLNASTTAAQCLIDQSHAWSVQQASWNHGAMNNFVAAQRAADATGGVPQFGSLCMGYLTRRDIPFHYALADAFTICDRYHCSVLGPTYPNRIMSMSGTADGDGTRGGPCVDNSQQPGQLRWTSYPERLQKAGVSWFVYQEKFNDDNNVLPLFAGIHAAPAGSDLYRRANTYIPTPPGASSGPALLARLRDDVRRNRLPHVSWILASALNCEHPPSTPAAGANFIAGVLRALTSNPRVWAKTALFLCYDENDGIFDHVPPPTAPAGTPGEYVSPATAAKYEATTQGVSGPIGLGMRVPMIVISPYSRGGMVCSDVFDHTSLLRFLERRFGVHEPNISHWRRGVTGDLVSAFGCLSRPAFTFPRLPRTGPLLAEAKSACANEPAPRLPRHQKMPRQERGTRPRVGRACYRRG